MIDAIIIISSASFMVCIGLMTMAIKWVSDSIDNLTKEVDVIGDELAMGGWVAGCLLFVIVACILAHKMWWI